MQKKTLRTSLVSNISPARASSPPSPAGRQASVLPSRLQLEGLSAEGPYDIENLTPVVGVQESTDRRVRALRNAIREGDTEHLRRTIENVSGLPIGEVRRRRKAQLNFISEGSPKRNTFESELDKIMVLAEVYLERWQRSDSQARIAEYREAEQTRAGIFCRGLCLKYCSFFFVEAPLQKPAGIKTHNVDTARRKKEMMGRPTIDSIEISDLYASPRHTSNANAAALAANEAAQTL